MAADISRDPSLLQRTDTDGYTLLIYASGYGHLAVVELLLDQKADKDQADNVGRTPLSVAAYNGKLEVAELLLRRNVRLDIQDQIGRTALDLATLKGHTAIVDLLTKVRAWGLLLSRFQSQLAPALPPLADPGCAVTVSLASSP